MQASGVQPGASFGGATGSSAVPTDPSNGTMAGASIPAPGTDQQLAAVPPGGALQPIVQLEERQNRTESSMSRMHEQVMFLAHKMDRHDFQLGTLTAQTNNQRAQPIIIQNHASSNVENTAPPAQPSGDPALTGLTLFLDNMLSDMRSWWRSPLNRFCVYCAGGLGMYLLQQRMQHSWRLAEIQRRIDANIMLKMSQWLSKNMD
ncbi:unnamed protein product [Amoebophrya sp. A25]|nr:unnamed protein product [Amoebophrya sp. A25]|eukprot:GSA25T00002459001.1